MTKKFTALVLIGALLLAGCTSPDEAVRATAALGIKDVTTTGYRFFGCSEEDTFHTGFKGKNANGTHVSGVVWSNLLKGATVRTD